MSPREVEKKTDIKDGHGAVSLINSSANGSNPNPRDITWRAMQQRQAGDVWIYNDADLRRAMEASGVKQSYNFPEKPVPGFEIPSGNGTSRVDIRPLHGAQGAALRAAVAKHLGVTEAALMAGINAEHGVTSFLPMSSPPANSGANGAGGASQGGSSGTRIALRTDPYTIRRSRAQISGDVASLEAKKKELYDAMAASADPHMTAKKAAYDSSSAANAMWDAKNPDAQLKINRNYTLGHEVKLQVNSAAKDLLEQAKGMDPAAAMDNLRASASHPDLAKYKELQDKYKTLASQGKWGAASEVLAEQHALVQGKPDLISAIAAEKALAELSGGASAANIDAAILKMTDDSAKVEADLKRLEIREYDVQLIKLKPQVAITSTPLQGGNSPQGSGPGGGGTSQGGGVGPGSPSTNALPLLGTDPVTAANVEALLRIDLDGTTPGLITGAKPEAKSLGLNDGDQIVGITGSQIKSRIANPSNQQIRDTLWDNKLVELEVKRKGTGKIDKIYINLFKNDPQGRYPTGSDFAEEDVRVTNEKEAFPNGRVPNTNIENLSTALGVAKLADAGIPWYKLGVEKVRDGGAKIEEITANSFLDKAGFSDNDMITSVGGNKIKKHTDLEAAFQSEIASIKPGSSKDIVILFDRDTVGLIGRPMNHRALIKVERKADGTFSVHSSTIERRQNTTLNSLTLGIAGLFGAEAWEWVKV